MFKIFKISGDSLYPLYKDGERMFCRRITKNSLLKINDIVVFKRDNIGLMVKQIASINLNKYELKGTIPYSHDSRNFGYIDRNNILFKALFKI
ncbi:MAG: hypothetical protein HF962_02165 [Sulfurovum sp.]|nr:hypothetical protein [Sulfurovum sp.]